MVVVGVFMTDNYPVLCTVRFKDRRFNIVMRIRVKPVTMKFGQCSNPTCWKSSERQLWHGKDMSRCSSCKKQLENPYDLKMFKVYTNADTLIRAEYILVLGVRWNKAVRFRRGTSRWASKEIYGFKRDWASLNEWFRYNRDGVELDGKNAAVSRADGAWKGKVTLEWRKDDLPSEQELDDLFERRALLRRL
jgi:hypothetical protein